MKKIETTRTLIYIARLFSCYLHNMIVPKCMSCHKAIVVIIKRKYSFHDCYPKHLVQREMKDIKFININRIKRQKGTKGVNFVVTYHPLLKSLQGLINKHLNILYIDE